MGCWMTVTCFVGDYSSLLALLRHLRVLLHVPVNSLIKKTMTFWYQLKYPKNGNNLFDISLEQCGIIRENVFHNKIFLNSKRTWKLSLRISTNQKSAKHTFWWWHNPYYLYVCWRRCIIVSQWSFWGFCLTVKWSTVLCLVPVDIGRIKTNSKGPEFL